MNSSNLITIVVPTYGEGENVSHLYEALETNLVSVSTSYEFNYIFVNDGSIDDTCDVLRELAKLDKKVKVIDLSRNFGKEIALTAGVHEALSSKAIICLDADMQHPPNLIPDMIQKWESGAEIVIAIRKESEDQPIFRWLGSKVYYWIINKISEVEMTPQSTDFRLYDNKVIEAFKRATERQRMFRGIMDWLGFKREYVYFSAPKRMYGSAGYSYAKLFSLAVNSITSFSLWPLKIAGYLGLLLIVIVSGIFLYFLGFYLIYGVFIISPLAIVALLNTLLIGVVLVAIGLVALYVGSIHTEVINRPLYVVREKINF
ncbi:glycosyltransferase family 2 protein [Polynucleobacter sp. MWH-UH35A]|uniref:glycosyltransferase family 2 protein n=1 Tax=Polynucleobacter sp. MWH-UH35A TaxID=1855619 RepID=UPI001BFDD24E|nr:glycosyltransferase family 2 protein [Polynucleobacter sp. MWH-UH35A]QWD60439.1 glycosyltransferase family 2 protein [Polynucleobacter sp. MWH-UH35A]